MIGKLLPCTQPATAAQQGTSKSLWVADAAKGRRRLLGQTIERLFSALEIDQYRGCLCGLHLNCLRRVVSRAPHYRPALVERDHVRAIQHHHVGPAQGVERLAQQAAGKHMAVAERLQGVEHHQIQVPGEPAVLETVVEQNQFRLQLVDGQLRGSHPIGILQVRHIGQAALQLQRFVVARAGFGTIAATDDHHAYPTASKPAGQPAHHGRLAGSAQCEIAHAHYGHVHAVDQFRPSVITPIAPAHGQGIRPFEHGQGHPQPRGSRPPATTAYQRSELRTVDQGQRLAPCILLNLATIVRCRATARADR